MWGWGGGVKAEIGICGFMREMVKGDKDKSYLGGTAIAWTSGESLRFDGKHLATQE